MSSNDGIIGAICTVIIVLILIIKIAPALADLQTTYRAKEITDNAKDKDISETTKDFTDLAVDTVEGEVWSALWAPIIGFVVAGLIALYAFLRKHS